MNKLYNYTFLYIILSMLLLSCATNKAQYGKHINALKTENKEYNSEIEHTFYLIGDAGYTKIGEDLSPFQPFKKGTFYSR